MDGALTPEERERRRRRWKSRRNKQAGLPSEELSWREQKTKAKRKANQRRKRNGSVHRRKVSKYDGRRAKVKAMKANGDWPPIEMRLEADDFLYAAPIRIVPQPSPARQLEDQAKAEGRYEGRAEDVECNEGITRPVRVGNLTLKPRAKPGAIRAILSADSMRQSPEPQLQSPNIIPADKT